MNSIEKFLSLDAVKQLRDQGKDEEIGRMAISLGTVAADNALREFGAKLLSKEAR